MYLSWRKGGGIGRARQRSARLTVAEVPVTGHHPPKHHATPVWQLYPGHRDGPLPNLLQVFSVDHRGLGSLPLAEADRMKLAWPMGGEISRSTGVLRIDMLAFLACGYDIVSRRVVDNNFARAIVVDRFD